MCVCVYTYIYVHLTYACVYYVYKNISKYLMPVLCTIKSRM